MTPKQIELVQASWRLVIPIEDTAAVLFYNRLFELDPSLRKMFRGNMQQQGHRLMTMLGYAVAGLSQLDVLVPALRDLGRRHRGYGVAAAHYEMVGSAFLWTLEKGLGAAFTPEVKDAWAAVYGVMASTMQEAAAMPATSPLQEMCEAIAA
jgi:hemoglobin-like flavoprotein